MVSESVTLSVAHLTLATFAELEGSACVKISEPGEIRKEFECSQAQLDKEMRAKQEIEEKASAKLIQKLQVCKIKIHT